MASRENPGRVMIDALLARRFALIGRKDEITLYIESLQELKDEKTQVQEDIDTLDAEIAAIRAAKGL